MTAKLNTDGKMYAILLNPDDKVPDSQQIRDGLNAYNEALDSQRVDSVEVKDSATAQLSFLNTDDNTEYSIWVTAENDRFGVYPDLMSDT